MILIEEGYVEGAQGKKTHSPLANAKFVSISRFACVLQADGLRAPYSG